MHTHMHTQMYTHTTHALYKHMCVHIYMFMFIVHASFSSQLDDVGSEDRDVFCSGCELHKFIDVLLFLISSSFNKSVDASVF